MAKRQLGDILYTPEVCSAFLEVVKEKFPAAVTGDVDFGTLEKAFTDAQKGEILTAINEKLATRLNVGAPEAFNLVLAKAAALSAGNCIACCKEPRMPGSDRYCVSCYTVVSRLLAFERFSPSVKEKLQRFHEKSFPATDPDYKVYEASLLAEYVPKKCSYTGMPCSADSLTPDCLFSNTDYPELATYGPNYFFIDEGIKRLKASMEPTDFVAYCEKFMLAVSSPDDAVKQWKRGFLKRILEIRREFLLDHGLCVCADLRRGICPKFVLLSSKAHEDVYTCDYCQDVLTLNLVPRHGADLDFMNDFVRNHGRCICGTPAHKAVNKSLLIDCGCSFGGQPFNFR